MTAIRLTRNGRKSNRCRHFGGGSTTIAVFRPARRVIERWNVRAENSSWTFAATAKAARGKFQQQAGPRDLIAPAIAGLTWSGSALES